MTPKVKQLLLDRVAAEKARDATTVVVLRPPAPANAPAPHLRHAS